MRKPQKPDESEVSVTVISQLVGSVVRSEEHTSELQSHSDLVCRLLLEKKIAVKGTDPRIVVAPLTFFWTTRVVPLIYALYQLLVLLQRRTAPRFVLL